MSRRILLCFVLVLVLALVASLSQAKEEPHVVTKHDKDGVLTVVIDMSGSKKKKVEKKAEKVAKVDESKLKVDSLSKQAAAIIETSISSKEATQIAQDLLTLANEIRNVEKLIPGDQEKEKKDLKDQLTVIVSNLVQQAETPKALLLESSLVLAAQQKKAEQSSPVDYDKVSVEDLLGNSKKSSKGAKTLIIPSNPWDWAALGLNFVDGIGTYSQKFNKVGEFMKGKVADKLEKWNMKSLASVSRNAGSSISSYSKKLEPYEQKAAKFIAPVVKSKTFQVITKSVNVVSGVLSVHGGLKALNLIKGGGVKLPTSYAALKTTLSKVVAKSNTLIKNGKTFITSSGKVTKIVGASKKALTTAGRLTKLNAAQFKRMSTWNKIRHVDGIYTGYDAAKGLKGDLKNVKNRVTNKLKNNTPRKAPTGNNRSNSRNTKNTRNTRNTGNSRNTRNSSNGRSRSSSNTTRRQNASNTRGNVKRSNSSTTRTSSTKSTRSNISSRKSSSGSSRRTAPTRKQTISSKRTGGGRK
ncbi:predicted protein [Naegleria gruberi]|uniref:Predicted protein n=1 Tax=Naegleria gruberi TaxID=5762 RepID=D2W0G6_NAEGR|nr:uncharacterized protein NAEGRDRAFT_74850 [Naegleria gruberi]EFC37425.1 predicted protein [Naegleria gruberi]|eukprot:XP_002670169.1 predicted protein [Naegleria gruberi strain NEG-M]